MRSAFYAALAAMLLLFGLSPAFGQATPAPAPTSHVSVQQLAPIQAQKPAVHFDALKATNAYLATVKGEARAKSDAYFEGGYWLILIDTLYAIVVAGILLWLHIASGVRDWAGTLTRSRFWQVPICVAIYTVLIAILTLPLTWYEGFYREHYYGLSNLNFVQWLGQFGKGLLLSVIGVAIVATFIYAVVRATPRFWWLWGTVVAVIFMGISLVVEPVLIEPLFNHYYPLKDGPVKQEILSLARANEIPADNVYEFNASKQSKRISANVSGFLGTTQISMTDNLINLCSEREIKAVLGYEMGHYVLDHGAIGLTWFGLVILIGFAFVNFGFRFMAGIFGGNWNVRTIDDPAGYPLVVALFSVFLFFATPVTNTITRTLENQADAFGLNAAREPDGFATVILKLSNYRKLDPSPWEETIFYDHPSGRTRIMRAMTWKAEHLNDPDIKAGPVSPQ